MIDLILACLAQCGPSRLTLWTWAIAQHDVNCVERLMMEGKIKSALLVIHTAIKGRDRDLMLRWQAKWGKESIRWVINHAKLATIESEEFKLLLRGSLNLNFNPRFENFDLDEGHPGFELVREIEASLPVLEFEHEEAEVRRATGIDAAFAAAKLRPFGDFKTWST
jgi:hypothetical protein